MIVVWRITQRCNLSCPFCEWDRNLPKERLHVPAEKVMRMAHILSAYQQSSGDRVLLSWLGGEPLLWPHLHDLAPRVKQLGLAQSTTTNGTTLLAPRIQDLILENFSELTVSIDGLADFHDRVRNWPGGWQQICTALTTLAARRGKSRAPRLRANIVLMHDNLSDFAELCEILASWGIDEITFNALGGRDRPEFYAQHRLLPQDTLALSAMLPELRKRLAMRGTKLCGGDDYLARICASSMQQRIPVENCMPGEKFLFIDEFGQIAPCNFTTRSYSISIDDLSNVGDLTALPSHFSRQRLASPDAVCEDCPSTQVFAKFTA